MAQTPSPPDSPRSDLLRVIGSPAGRALAVKVEQACALIRPLEISDMEYTLGSNWRPPIPISNILHQVLCPAVFVLQQALDPSFHRTRYGSFQFPYTTTCVVQATLQKMMKLVHLISLTDPEYPSYVALWDGISAVHLIPEEPPVSDLSMGQFEILDHMVKIYGFEGENSEAGAHMSAALEHLKRVATCWAALLGQRLRSNCARVEIPSWKHADGFYRPCHSMKDLLRYVIRAQIFFVQLAVDPEFRLSVPLPALSVDDRAAVRTALGRVLEQLRVIYALRPHFARLARAYGARIHPDELLVPGESSNMFRILRILLAEYGFELDEEGQHGVLQVSVLRAFDAFDTTASYMRAATAQLKEFPEYNMDGSSTFTASGNDAEPTEKWHSGLPCCVIISAVFFIDLDMEEELVRYAVLKSPTSRSKFSSPFVIRSCSFEIVSVARDSPWIRHQTSVYMRYLAYIRRAIVPDVHGIVGKRVPTPSVASLLYMMHLIHRFGFAGDDIATIAECAEDDLLIIFNHAHETIFAMATRLADVPPQYVATLSEIQMAPPGGVLSSSPLLSVHITNLDHEPDAVSPSVDPVSCSTEGEPVAYLIDIIIIIIIIAGDENSVEPRTTEELTRIPEALQLLLAPYRSCLPDSHLYGEDPHSVLRYFEEVVSPYAQLIDKAFPTRALAKHQLRAESIEFLTPHVGELLRFLGIAYVIALEVVSNYGPPMLFPCESIRTLCLMQKFHEILDNPAYELGPGLETIMLGWVKLMVGSARQHRLSHTDPIDIRPPRDLAHVPCVPSWTVEEIAVLQEEEAKDTWVAEKYWLRERVEACNRAGKELSDVLSDVAGAEWYPAGLPLTQTSDLLAKVHSILPPATRSRMEPSLRALWVSQVRNLCQGIHETMGGRIFTEFPAPLRNELRVAVKILLSSIILIGATKISVESDPSNPSQYYVPGFGAMMFAMAEQFVVLCGYEGNEDVPSREGIFRAVALLQHAMVIHPDYATTPVEAPGYSSAQADLFFYGVGTRTKERQIREILDHGHLLHRFGDNLLRYDHTLGSRAYRIPTWYPIPSSSLHLPAFEMRGPTYTIETALPRLYSLSLPAETLHAKFFFPEDGLENFLQFRMRVFVHTLMRAITHDFTHFTSLPAFPPPEHQKLRAWIEILMTHFRLVSRRLKHRTERISTGDLSWASYSFHVPAEAVKALGLRQALVNASMTRTESHSAGKQLTPLDGAAPQDADQVTRGRALAT
ncbi:hypothetical protein C8F04DRAFT_1196205 [Mycena alexandri]|uniref:Uncharacterized protein n=1 Tax=Mycena alexandri TaxID=1745969 RepID=A0AAD6WPV5_9AGAR|nr:hypothetical protein C8F04DRAFT_1196205 [Mycena alexandri]